MDAPRSRRFADALQRLLRHRRRPAAGVPAWSETEDQAPKLRELNATLTRILGAIDEYVYTGEILPDDGYRLVYAGPCREQFLGTTAEVARTVVWADFVHPDDRSLFRDGHQRGVETGSLDLEYRLIGADGETRWVRDRGRLRFEDGRTFLDGSILNVTDVHDAQERLLETVEVLSQSERRTQAILEAASEAFISIDAAGGISDWNAEAERLFGWRADEVLHRELGDVIGHSPARGAPADDLARFLAEPERLLDKRVELPAIHRDGHHFPIEIRMAVATTGDSRTVYAFIHDITARKEVEQRRAEDAENLAAIIEASREMARGSDAQSARSAICRAALGVTGADATLLFEPDPGGLLVLTAAAGVALPPAGITIGPGPSGVGSAYTSRQRLFVGQAQGHPDLSADLVEVTGARSVLLEPVVREHEVVGVLSIIWRTPVPDLPNRIDSVLPLLAAEAAVAIHRADLLARLASAARTDPLTGLANRRALEEELPRALAVARLRNRPLWVVMLDLDHFKSYNDTHGHQAGDRLLRAAAASWRAGLREGDLLVRYGGEEFVGILPDCEEADAVAIVDRLRRATPDGQTCSGGLARWIGTESADALIGRADAALYVSKDAGRDRLEIAEEPREPQPAGQVSS